MMQDSLQQWLFLKFTGSCSLAIGSHAVTLKKRIVHMKKKKSFCFLPLPQFFQNYHSGKHMFHHKHLQEKKKKLRKKLKTSVTPLIAAPIKSGPLELRCELAHNTTTTPLPALLSRLPHKFLPVRGLSVSLILCLYLSFFARNSHRFSQSSLFFFFLGWKYRPGLWQQKGSEELKQRLFSLLSRILLTHCRQYTQNAYMCVAALLWLRKPEGRTAAYSSLSCTHDAISWSVSVSKGRQFSFTTLDIIKNNQKIL